MGCEDEVLKIGKKLDKMVSKNEQNQDQALDLLKVLRDLPITLEVLQKTRIGMSVNSLRKSSSDDEVISLSKVLIKTWKKLLSGSPASKSDGNNRESKLEATNGGSGDEGHTSPSSTSSSTAHKATSPVTTAPKQTSFPATTNDNIRLKCREMLANALKTETGESPEENQDPDDLAAKIEDTIYNEFRDTNMKYKNKVRSRVSNLKDSKNPTLRLNVLRGQITPDRLATMTAEEMASDEMKQLRMKFTKESINDHQMAVTGGTKTDLLKCGKCKQSNCTYNQVQTRSADEPMTTFVYCNVCGNRWKFC